MFEYIGHTTMATIIMLDRGIIIQTHATTATTEIMTITDILTKIKVRKTTTGLIRIAEEKTEEGVEEVDKSYFRQGGMPPCHCIF